MNRSLLKQLEKAVMAHGDTDPTPEFIQIWVRDCRLESDDPGRLGSVIIPGPGRRQGATLHRHDDEDDAAFRERAHHKRQELFR